jgi:hypothetical protein
MVSGMKMVVVFLMSSVLPDIFPIFVALARHVDEFIK